MFFSKIKPSFLAWSCVMLGLSHNLGAVLPEPTEATATTKATASVNTAPDEDWRPKKTINLRRQHLAKVDLSSDDLDVQVLDLSDTNVSDLSNLPQYTHLEKLVLNGCRNPDLDLSVLTQCKALRFLDLSCIKGNLDLSFLKDCNIETLFIQCRDDLTDLNFLAGCTGIKQLYVGGRNLKTLNGIGALANLEKLQFSSNALTTLDGVEHCTHLTTLRVFRGDRLHNVHALQNHPSLEHATIDYFPGTNLDAFKGCAKLESLRLTDCFYLKNLNGFEGENIQSIQIENGKELQSINAVAAWTKLETVYLKDTYVLNLSPLMELPQLISFYTNKGVKSQIEPVEAMVKERRRQQDLNHSEAY